MKSIRTRLACLFIVILALPLSIPAQQGGSARPFKAEELDQLAAPIALYPDPLVAQVLMASTYPLEIVQAARFVKDNPSLKGDHLNEALKKQTWDDSVKSLVSFPQVLTMMDQKLDWTQKLGDAFLAEQKELMGAIQRLRARAQAEGNLKSTPEQNVTVEPAGAAAPALPAPTPAQPQGPPPQTVVIQQAPPTVIRIESTNPQVVYVPTYNPTVVYGAWPYPAYPPYYYYPPGYAAATAAVSFGLGMAVGAAVWGNCDWHGGHADVNINQYNSYTKNVNNTNVANQRIQTYSGSGQGTTRTSWQHNPENRKGVQYRDPSTQQRYNKAATPQTTQARESFRGRAEQGRQDLAREGAGQSRSPAAGGGQRPGQTAGGGLGAQRAGGQAQAGAGAGQQFGQQRQGGGSGGAFEGLGQGKDVQNFSSRGQTSRQSMGAAQAGGRSQGKASPAAATRSGGGRRR